MGLVKATQRTIAALKKADALTGTTKISSKTSSSFNNTSLLKKNSGLLGSVFIDGAAEEYVGEWTSYLEAGAYQLPIISWHWSLDAESYYEEYSGRVMYKNAFYLAPSFSWQVPGDVDGWWVCLEIPYTASGIDTSHTAISFTPEIRISRPGLHITRLYQIYFKQDVVGGSIVEYRLAVCRRHFNGPIVIQDQWEMA